MEALLFSIAGAYLANQAYVSIKGQQTTALVPSAQALAVDNKSESPVKDCGGASCALQRDIENSEDGRPDNLPTLQPVYKDPATDPHNFSMPSDDIIGWGGPNNLPHRGRSGQLVSKWNDASVMSLPKREVGREEMWPVEGDPNSQWDVTSSRGYEYARRTAQTSLASKSHTADGALNGYTPFDFEQKEGSNVATVRPRPGFAGGRFWTREPQGVSTNGASFGPDRYVYPGPMKRGLVTHSLRALPAGGSGTQIGVANGRPHYYQHGRTTKKKSDLVECHREPERQVQPGGLARVGLAHVLEGKAENRSSDYWPANFEDQIQMGELIAK